MSPETLSVQIDGAVLTATIDAPPMNLMTPELVRDLGQLILQSERDDSLKVLVFRSADPDYFISHVDVTQLRACRQESEKLTGESSLGLLFRHMSASRLVTIAEIEGRVRGVGSEFILACDMRFAALETATFGQFEAAFGVIPGAGGLQHLARLLGRSRALEVMLSAEDYPADLAERYGWINRALPAVQLSGFVRSLAQRIAKFPAAGHVSVKARTNDIELPSADDIRRDSAMFIVDVMKPEVQRRLKGAIDRGFQARDAEMNLAQLLGRTATE
jgi:enoyl-CoA hydratase/carnithine racemase